MCEMRVGKLQQQFGICVFSGYLFVYFYFKKGIKQRQNVNDWMELSWEVQLKHAYYSLFCFQFCVCKLYTYVHNAEWYSSDLSAIRSTTHYKLISIKSQFVTLLPLCEYVVQTETEDKVKVVFFFLYRLLDFSLSVFVCDCEREKPLKNYTGETRDYKGWLENTQHNMYITAHEADERNLVQLSWKHNKIIRGIDGQE